MSASKAKRRPKASRPVEWVRGALLGYEVIKRLDDAAYPTKTLNPGAPDFFSPALAKLSGAAMRKGFAQMLTYGLRAVSSGQPFYHGYLHRLAEFPPARAHHEWQRILKEQAATPNQNERGAA